MSWADVANRTPKPERKTNKCSVHQGGGSSLKRVEDFIARHTIKARGPMPYKDGLKWQVDCPFNPEHKSPDALITVADDGAIGFKCSHESCSDKHGWKQLREHFGETGPEPARQRVRIKDAPRVTAAGKAISYVREPELIEGTITALVGDAGCGKSTVATAYARDVIAAGRSVLFLDRENSREGVCERMNRLGLADSDMLIHYGAWVDDVPGVDDEDVIGWVRECAPKPLVVIDSLVTFLDGDENSASDMRTFMDRVRALANLGATVLVLHHNGKAATAQSYRGSSYFKGGVDQAFRVTNNVPDGHLDRLTLKCFKSRFGFGNDSVFYRYDGGRFTRDVGATAKARDTRDVLWEIVLQQPGLTKSQFEMLAAKQGIHKLKVRDFINMGVEEGTLMIESAAHGAQRIFLTNAGETRMF